MITLDSAFFIFRVALILLALVCASAGVLTLAMLLFLPIATFRAPTLLREPLSKVQEVVDECQRFFRALRLSEGIDLAKLLIGLLCLAFFVVLFCADLVVIGSLARTAFQLKDGDMDRPFSLMGVSTVPEWQIVAFGTVTCAFLTGHLIGEALGVCEPFFGLRKGHIDPRKSRPIAAAASLVGCTILVLLFSMQLRAASYVSSFKNNPTYAAGELSSTLANLKSVYGISNNPDPERANSPEYRESTRLFEEHRKDAIEFFEKDHPELSSAAQLIAIVTTLGSVLVGLTFDLIIDAGRILIGMVRNFFCLIAESIFGVLAAGVRLIDAMTQAPEKMQKAIDLRREKRLTFARRKNAVDHLDSRLKPHERLEAEQIARVMDSNPVGSRASIAARLRQDLVLLSKEEGISDALRLAITFLTDDELLLMRPDIVKAIHEDDPTQRLTILIDTMNRYGAKKYYQARDRETAVWSWKMSIDAAGFTKLCDPDQVPTPAFELASNYVSKVQNAFENSVKLKQLFPMFLKAVPPEAPDRRLDVNFITADLGPRRNFDVYAIHLIKRLDWVLENGPRLGIAAGQLSPLLAYVHTKERAMMTARYLDKIYEVVSGVSFNGVLDPGVASLDSTLAQMLLAQSDEELKTKLDDLKPKWDLK